MTAHLSPSVYVLRITHMKHIEGERKRVILVWHTYKVHVGLLIRQYAQISRAYLSLYSLSHCVDTADNYGQSQTQSGGNSPAGLHGADILQLQSWQGVTCRFFISICSALSIIKWALSPFSFMRPSPFFKKILKLLLLESLSQNPNTHEACTEK